MRVLLKNIGKDLANVMLEGNTDNRKVNADHVSTLASFMTQGLWKFDGSPLRISKTGRLLDGQHRLKALIASEKSFDFIVIYDLEDDVFDTIDTGSKRSINDAMHIAKVKNETTVGSIVKAIIKYEHEVYSDGGSLWYSRLVSPQAVLGEYNTKSDYYQQLALDACSIYFRNKSLSPTELGVIIHVLRPLNEDFYTAFFEKYALGNNLSLGSPILVLRNKLSEAKNSQLRVTFKMKLNLVFTAWNYYRKSRNLKTLKYSTSTELIKPI